MDSAHTTARRRVRRPAALVAGAAALGIIAGAPAIASAATVSYPSNQTIDTPAGWTADGARCEILGGVVAGLNLEQVLSLLQSLGITCTVGPSHTPTAGSPGGALQVEVGGLLNTIVQITDLLGEARVEWVSDDFVHGLPATTGVELKLDAQVQGLQSLLATDNGARITAFLDDVTAAGSTQLATWTLGKDAADWRTLGAGAISNTALVPGHTYRLRLAVAFDEAFKVLGAADPVLRIDNVVLRATDDPGGFNGGDGNDGNDGTGGNGGNGGGDGLDGAGGLGACGPTGAVVVPPDAPGAGGTVTLSRRQLLINQRISQAAVRRVNGAIDKLRGGLTTTDFQECTIPPAKFDATLLGAVASGAPAAGATPGGTARPVPARPTSGGGTITLTVRQLLINQRISQAAVRRVNAIQKRLDGNLTAGDFRPGGLDAVALNTDARRTFARPLPAGATDGGAFVPLDLGRAGAGSPGKVTLTAQQLRINQRISQAAVRRINSVRAQFKAGLSGQAIKDGSLRRSNLASRIQLGTR